MTRNYRKNQNMKSIRYLIITALTVLLSLTAYCQNNSPEQKPNTTYVADKKAKKDYKVVKTAKDEESINSTQNFRIAKKRLVKIVSKLENPQTLYCGCDIIIKKNGYLPDLESCGYKVRKNEKRASRIEAEHMMPAHEFGGQRECWLTGKRSNCERTDVKYQEMEGDLHNLYPAVGEVNGDRKNYKYAQSVNGHSPYGKCQMVIDTKRQRVMIPDRAKGQVARAYLYMSERYNIALSNDQKNLFNQWNNHFKPTKNECLYNELVAKEQGNDNPFVTKKCKN